jgi:N6-adenosine-specific RNA methylase IME4
MPLAELKEHEAGESSCSRSWYQIHLAAAPAGWGCGVTRCRTDHVERVLTDVDADYGNCTVLSLAWRDPCLSIITAPRREHSQKPDEAHALIEAMYPDLPKIELFGRNVRPGWSAWGNNISHSRVIEQRGSIPA